MTEIRSLETGEVLHTVDAPTLRGADLHGAKLAGADLHGANLSNTRLAGADLRGADLSNARLYRTHLDGADLRGANLRTATLTAADLAGADFRCADLRRSTWYARVFRQGDLRQIRLAGADLRGARLNGWTLLPVLEWFGIGLVTILAFYGITWYIWPRDRVDLTFVSALRFSVVMTCFYYVTMGLPYDLRRVDLRGAIWDETTRWPWRFRPDTPPLPVGGNSSQQGV
jgi:hypothetical protein